MSEKREGDAFLSGFVAFAGPPNAGKSTLLNRILGTKVAIVTEKPHTTRNQIRGILTREDFQAVFVDTPGFHEEGRLFNRILSKSAVNAMEGVDMITVVLDCCRRRRRDEEAVLSKVSETGLPSILVLNKVDRIDRKKLLPMIADFDNQYDFEAIVPLSAKRGTGVEDFIQEVKKRLPTGPMLYDAETVTDQTVEQIIAELVREKIFILTRQEIPYSTAVMVEHIEEYGGRLHIQAVIMVERPSQKGMLVGKGGRFIKKIGSMTRQELKERLGKPVHLELWVKVARGWSKKTSILSELGIVDGYRGA